MGMGLSVIQPLLGWRLLYLLLLNFFFTECPGWGNTHHRTFWTLSGSAPCGVPY